MRAVRHPTCQYTRSHKQCAQLTATMFLPPTTRHTKHEWEGGRMGGGVMGDGVGWKWGGGGGNEWSNFGANSDLLLNSSTIVILFSLLSNALHQLPQCGTIRWAIFRSADSGYSLQWEIHTCTCSQRKAAAVESSHRDDDDDQKKSNIQKWD